jgi:tRNA threonylcarbamoyladenosine biosynthesis protein TsaE
MLFKNVTLKNLHKLAHRFSKILAANDLVLLEGEIGTGKTTFTNFLLQALAKNTTAVSPSFTLINQYETPSFKIFHMDLYRINNQQEIALLDIQAYLNRKAVVIIEWAEKLEKILLDQYIKLEFTYPKMAQESLHTRNIKLTFQGKKYWHLKKSIFLQ